MVNRWTFSRGSLFLILFIAFFTLGVTGNLIYFAHQHEKNNSEQWSQLNAVATLAASQIDPGTHEFLLASSDQTTPAYTDQVASLKKILVAFPQIEELTTVRTTAEGSQTVLQAINPNSSRPKTFLVTAPTSPGHIVPDTHRPTALPLAQNDQFGQWMVATTPLYSEEGEQVGHVLAYQSASDYQITPVDRQSLTIVLVGSGVLSFGLAWLLSVLLGVRHNVHVRKEKPKRRRIFAETLLLITIVYLVIEGGHSFISLRNITEARSQTFQSLEFVVRLKDILEHQQEPTPALRTEAAQLGLGQVLEAAFPGDGVFDSEPIDEAQQHHLGALAQQNVVAENLTSSHQRIALIAAMVAAVSLFLARYANVKNEEVIKATALNLSTQNRYQNVVKNLPVGLFTIKEGQFEFENEQWSQYLRTAEGSDPLRTWLQSVHPEDRPRVIDAFEQAEHNLLPFAVQYRMVGTDATVHYMETRGVPIPASSEESAHLLGFSVDVTSTIAAKEAMQEAFRIAELKNGQLSNALSELEQSLASMVRCFVKAVEAKDPYTAGHSERVMKYAMLLGKEIGLAPYELRILELGTLVHDVGKIGVPDAILTKPGRLTDDEFDVVKSHPVWGVEIVRHIGLFKECLPIVRSHHEKLNGAGYPDRLKGDEISELVRITTIADMFDAMTSDRSYRDGMPVEEVLGIMQQSVDKGEIDAQLFSVFSDLVRRNGILPQTGPELSDLIA